MSRKVDKNAFEVSLLSKAYIHNKRLIAENSENIIHQNAMSLKASFTVVKHIEYCVNCLDERNKFIIENEVLLGKTGKWYRGYYSDATYYRTRKIAYKEFLNCL